MQKTTHVLATAVRPLAGRRNQSNTSWFRSRPIRAALAIVFLVAAVRATLSVPDSAGYASVSNNGWSMLVPTSWETYGTGGLFGNPFGVLVAFPKELADSAAPRAVTMQVLRFPREDATYHMAVFELTQDPWCALPNRLCDEVIVSMDVVGVGGRVGVLREARRADGSHRWALVVQNDCYTYVADAQVSADRLDDHGAVVARALSTAKIAGRSRSLLGSC
jgi:hypothetical protein